MTAPVPEKNNDPEVQQPMLFSQANYQAVPTWYESEVNRLATTPVNKPPLAADPEAVQLCLFGDLEAA